MRTRAAMVARSERFVWIDLPDIAEHQRLTIDTKTPDFPGHDFKTRMPGDTFTVELVGGIVNRPSPFSGWTADITESTS